MSERNIRTLVAAAIVLSSLCTVTTAENIVFPDDAGVINVKSEPYRAHGDGLHDDTAAIQQALDDYPNGNRIIYLPIGTYLVSDTLRWPAGSGGSTHKRTIMQGQSRDGTIVQLKNNCPAYQDPKDRKAVIWTGPKPAQRFRNSIRTLTVHIGRDNPGACGIQFNCSNQGTIRRVKIVSGDGRGLYGLDLGYTNEIGPMLIRNLLVVGFDVGIKTNSTINSMTLERVALENQNVVGIDNGSQVFSIRGLTSANSVTAIRNTGCLTLLDAELTCTDPVGNVPAIINTNTMYGRNLVSSGYSTTVDNQNGHKRDAPASHVEEFVSHDVQSLFPSPKRSLNLPVKDTPAVPWDDLSQWVNPEDFGARIDDKKDDTAAIQAAIDSGHTTVYLPAGGVFYIEGKLRIRGNARRIIGTEARLKGSGTIVFEDGAHPVVVLERFNVSYAKLNLRHEASRTLVMSSAIGGSPVISTGSGDFFVDDVCAGLWRFENPEQHIWMRQINPENRDETNIVNNGATLWILGMKTEQARCKIETTNGGRTELLGAHVYAQGAPKINPLFRINNASASFACTRQLTFNNRYFGVLVEETRNGVTRKLERSDSGNTLALYTGYAGSKN